MLNLRHKIAIGRRLRVAVDGRRLLRGFAPIDPRRVPVGLTLQRAASSRRNVGRWSKVYDDYVGSEKLSRMQNNVFVVESDCVRSQNVRLGYQQQLYGAQVRLKDLHSELRNVSTVDQRYAPLFAEELRVLKEVRALSYDFHLVEEAEKENFLLYERTLAESQKEEWRKAKRSQKFLVYASLVGLVVGIAGTLASIYLHNYLYEDPALSSNRKLENLAAELASLIQSKNIIVRTFLQDLAVLLDSLPSPLVHEDEMLPLPLTEDYDQIGFPQLVQMVSVFKRKNKENSQEMARLLCDWRKAHDQLQVSAQPSGEHDAKTVSDLTLLWRTTFLYSLLVVGVPLAYSLLS